jgi:hypothetical protein
MATIKQTQHDLGNGYRGYVNGSRAQVYQGAAFLGQTDHAGNVVQCMPGVARETVQEQGRALLARAGIRAERPVAAQVPAAVRARAANWRCPNPRDCGDPTCDGSCGY